MEESPPAASQEERFRDVYATSYLDVLRFVSRRVHPTHAEDVVADVFLVVWRRIGDVPTSPDAARAWSFGVARQVILNAGRGERRREALAVRVADDASRWEAPGVDTERVARQLDLHAAWSRLPATDQEALALAYWDGLTSAGAAHVLGISPVAFRLRLTRARRALRRHLETAEEGRTDTPLPEGSPS